MLPRNHLQVRDRDGLLSVWGTACRVRYFTSYLGSRISPWGALKLCIQSFLLPVIIVLRILEINDLNLLFTVTGKILFPHVFYTQTSTHPDVEVHILEQS